MRHYKALGYINAFVGRTPSYGFIAPIYDLLVITLPVHHGLFPIFHQNSYDSVWIACQLPSLCRLWRQASATFTLNKPLSASQLWVGAFG